LLRFNTSDEARGAFNADYSYHDITRRDILILAAILEHELTEARECPSTQVMAELRLKKKLHDSYDGDGRLNEAYVRCSGPYFKNREAISFNIDGFVGFCGWADSKNQRPFLDAFARWVEYLNTGLLSFVR
jgi:hypothetical protein